MSLILEALRKSEAERRRGLAPDVAMELPPTPASRPRAMTTWLLPALAVAALLVVAGWWARHESVDSTSMATMTETADETLTLAPEAIASLPRATPRIEPRPAVVASTQALDTPAASAPPPAVSHPTPSIPAQMPTQPAPDPARPLPMAPGDISNDIAMLPPVKLSMLMWDDVPSKRFVILNGQRMTEGDHTGAITVIAIERSGVVLESNGAKVRVPLP